MKVTAFYHDPKPPRTYGNRGEWVVVLAFPDNLGFQRKRFDTEADALTFVSTQTDARRAA